jgi:class 3 adenylate cyclase/pimeloyl-ACP methyl ester carboxylesterase
MEPHIRYTRTSDGVNIAYATVGAGPPLVWVNDNPFSHLEFEFANDGMFDDASWKEFLKRRTLVRFDARGLGLSDRSVTRFGIDEWVLDMQAVVSALGLESFPVFAATNGGPVAIAYAARHPEQVSHLILQNSGARPADGQRTPRSQVMGMIMAHDFEWFSENAGAIAFGWDNPRARVFAKFIRAAVSPDTARHVFAALSRVDVSDLLPLIQAPTLVTNNRDLMYVTRQMSIHLASQIPNARLITIEGTLGDPGPWSSTILDFIEESPPAKKPPVVTPSGTVIILFIDIADSTALTERLGDAAFRAKSRDLDGALRTIIREHDGTAIEGKLLGDGVLAVFTSARQAITCAAICHAAAADVGLELHAGIHAGDVIRESDPDGRGNVYGGAVNIAARVAAASAAGETLVSQTVRDLARTSAGVSFEDRGEQALKGIDDEVRLFAVR